MSATLEQFAAQRGLTTDAEVQGHLHAGLRSAPTSKTYRRWYARELSRLQAAADATKQLYVAAVAAGDVIDPGADPLERLRRTAAGHPDNASTHAARRVLARRLASKSASTPGQPRATTDAS